MLGSAPADMDGWMKTMAAEPNHVSSAHDKQNAELTQKLFTEWGWDAKLETFKVLYPTPLQVGLELLGANALKATLTEAPIPGDARSARTKDELSAYVAYQGDGDVTAALVYVNYGTPADYKALERMGVTVKGKIIIARYGKCWRGLKPKLAYEHGAVGCIIYSDPRDDGFSVNDVYPRGAARPQLQVGLEWLARSARGDVFSRYHEEAGIAAEHCLAPSFGQTRWDRVVESYALLEQVAASPIHKLNRAVAVAEWRGPDAGLAVLDGFEPPSWLVGSYMWAAVLADLHRRSGNSETAERYRDLAIKSAPTIAVKDLLRRRLQPPVQANR